MKKIFAVYAEVEIKNIPKWLTEFRKKYSEPYDFHITLKQPCFVDETEITALKEKLALFFKKPRGSFPIIFNELMDSHVPMGQERSCIMLRPGEDVTSINSLQKDLVNYLGEFEYVELSRKKFEDNFEPHITIGDDLEEMRYREAMNELPKDILIESKINKIVLVVVREQTIEEALNPNNLTKFKL